MRLAGIGEKLLGLVMALALGLLGLFITVMTGVPVAESIPTYQWEKTDCYIETGWIEKDEPVSSDEWTVRIAYAYTWEGREFSSDRFAIQKRRYADSSRAGQVLMRFTPGSVRDCYVNPQQPGDAVLKRDPAWILIMLLGGLAFGLLLTGSGLFITYRVVVGSG